MRLLRTLTLTACLAGGFALTAGGASAQLTGSSSSTASSGGSASPSSGSSGGGSGSSTLGVASLSQTPMITGLNTSGSSAASVGQNQSNIFSGYYANPYYQGRNGATSTTLPGGFGQVLYGSSGSGSNAFGVGGTSTGGSAGRGTGTSASGGAGVGNTVFNSAAGGLSGQAGFGGNSGGGSRAQSNNSLGSATSGFNSASGSQVGGIIVQLPKPLSYTATLVFDSPRPTVAQVQSDLRGVLDRSSMLPSAPGITMEMDGPVVVLRGNVATADEVTLAENVLRLTPGVRDVRNELKVGPATPAVPVAAVPRP